MFDIEAQRRLLRTIAEALQVPVDSLFSECDDRHSVVADEDLEAELLAIFRRIEDREARKACLRLLKVMSREADG